MTIIAHDARRVNLQNAHSQRTPIRTYKPANANVTACVTYHDPTLGKVAVTHRSTLGAMRASTAIHFDAGVFDRPVAPQPAAMTEQPVLFAFAEPGRRNGGY